MKSKKCLTEACELVGPDGPFPCPSEEQDVVLELGSLWYNRYLLCDGQGVRFLADEALGAALRYYRECRELCVDLVADSSESVDRGGRGSGSPAEAGAAAADAAAAAASSLCLLRAEYNVGMSLFEQEKRADAVQHLSAAGSIFRDLFSGGVSKTQQRGWSGEGGRRGATSHRSRLDVEASILAAWKAAVPEEEDLADLGGVYASSLFLLGECLASRAPSHCVSSETLAGEEEGSQRAGEVLASSAQAFVDIEDAVGALNTLLKLSEILQPPSANDDDDGGGFEPFLSKVERLCERASLLLSPKTPGAGSDGDDLEDERNQLEQAREEISNLRARWRRSGGENSSGDSNNLGPERSGQLVSQQQNKCSLETKDAGKPLQRVGPLPTSDFAQRRRRLRTAAAAATVGRGWGGARNILGAISGNDASSRNRREPVGVVASAAEAPGSGREGLPRRLTARGSGGDGVVSVGEEWLARGGGGESFAALRAWVVAEDHGTVAISAALAPMATSGDLPNAEGRTPGERQRGREATAFNSYRAKA